MVVNRLPAVKTKDKEKHDMSVTLTTERVEESICASLVEFGVAPALVSSEARWDALDVDSLDLVELVQVIEDDFGVEITSQDMQNLATVGSVVELVVSRAV